MTAFFLPLFTGFAGHDAFCKAGYGDRQPRVLEGRHHLLTRPYPRRAAQGRHSQRHRFRLARVVVATKQRLAALVPSGPVMVLNLLRWGDEVKTLDAVAGMKLRHDHAAR